jgi:hypothetical protein
MAEGSQPFAAVREPSLATQNHASRSETPARNSEDTEACLKALGQQ